MTKDQWGAPYSHYAYQDAKRRKFFKKASLERQTARRNEAKYQSNICPNCHMARAVQTGACYCD